MLTAAACREGAIMFLEFVLAVCVLAIVCDIITDVAIGRRDANPNDQKERTK